MTTVQYVYCTLSFFCRHCSKHRQVDQVTSLWGNDYHIPYGNSIISYGVLQLILCNDGCPGSIDPPFLLFLLFLASSQYQPSHLFNICCRLHKHAIVVWSVGVDSYSTFMFTTAPSNVPGMSTYLFCS